MPELIMHKTPIGLSACLYDCPVRYNGKRFDAVSKLGRERAGVRVVILKEKSPSCGLFRVRIGANRRREVLGAGVFGALLKRTGWFLIPDTALDSALTGWDWRRMRAWLWLSDRAIASNGDLTSAWHVVKFIVQETQRAEAGAIGRELAALPKRAPAARLEELRGRMFDALRIPTTKQRALSYL